MVDIEWKMLSVGEDVEQLELVYIATGECKLIELLENCQCQVKYICIYTYLHRHIMPLLGIYSRKVKICLHKYLYAKMPSAHF